ELPGLGTMLSGYDGTTAWTMNPLQGPRILEGEEREAVVDGTKAGSVFRDSTVVASMKTTGRETIEGVDCWQVDITWKSGRESKDCFAVESGLLHSSTTTSESPMGSITVVT